MADMSVKFAGLRLDSPLIAASGPVTASAELAVALRDRGVGAVVAKTSLPDREYGAWIGKSVRYPYRPAFKYQSLAEGRLLSLPSLAALPLSGMAREVEEMKRRGVAVIGSVAAVSRRGYVEAARTLEDAGADALELNYCCTIPSPQRLFGVKVNFDPAAFASILADVKSRVSIPVGFKSTVSLYLYDKVIEGMLRAKLKGAYPDFATLAAQLDANPGVDLETLRPLVPDYPVMGWQGDLSPLAFSATAAFSSCLGTAGPPISASGGMSSAGIALQAMALGATTVQVHTAILDKGPDVVRTMLREMESWLDAKGMARASDLVGAASRDYIPSVALGQFMRDRDRITSSMRAEPDAAACSGCALCSRLCTEGAIAMAGGLPRIDAERCRACNLCVLKCPRKAMRLAGAEALADLVAEHRASPAAAAFRDFMGKERLGPLDYLSLPRRLKEWKLA